MSYNGKDVNLFTNGKAVDTNNRLPVNTTGSVSITGTVPLPTGAATSVNQDTGNTHLENIYNKLPYLPETGRMPVTPDSIVKSDNNYFSTNLLDNLAWDESWVSQGDSFTRGGGNSQGSHYLGISLSPFVAGSEYTLITKDVYQVPLRAVYGLSINQRILGQEVECSLISVLNNSIETISSVNDLSISGTVSITSNVATINFASDHGLKGNDRVLLLNNTEPRLNVGPVVVTVVSNTQITVPCTLANGTYTAGGIVRWIDPFKYAKNAFGCLYENTSATQASFCVRNDGNKYRYVTGQTIASLTANNVNTNPFTDAFLATQEMEYFFNQEELQIYSKTADSTQTANSNLQRFQNVIPDITREYRFRIRIKNLDNLTVPVAKITSIAKTGTTTATVTTSSPHGLATTDFVNIYGVRDQTNFPNLTTQTAVSSIINSTQFTIVIGTASTSSSAGGGVWKVQGSVTAPGAVTMAVQSISRTSQVLTVVGSASWSGLLNGEYIELYGCDATSMGLYDGPYKVLGSSGTSLLLESIGGDFGSINCGGAVARRTDVKLHYVRFLDTTRVNVDLSFRGGQDFQKSLPVNVTAGTVTTVSTVTTCNTVSAVTASNSNYPQVISDVTSAALTTTTTSSTITPTYGTVYTIQIPVTATSGTNQTLDVGVDESDDSGTNWYRVYDFPRITATGAYRSPPLKMRGNRIRYVQTVGGTSPSFTRAINRQQSSATALNNIQVIDRTIVPNTASSTSASVYGDGLRDFNMIVRCTAQTTAATIDLQASEDNTNWVTISGTSITTAVGVVRSSCLNVQAKFVRAIVTSAGTGITLGECIIKGIGV